MTAKKPQRHPRVDDPVVDQPAEVRLMENGTQFVTDPALVRSTWQELEESVKSVIDFDRHGREERLFPLAPFLGRLSGISVPPAVSVVASCRGDYQCEIYFDEEGKRRSFLEALKVEDSVKGFVEAAYLALHLPARFLSWRATCGCDYALLLDESVDWTYLPQGRALHEVLGPVDRQLGIRACKRRDKYYVSCLTAYYSGWIIDQVVRIQEGSLMVLPSPDVVWEPPIKLIY